MWIMCLILWIESTYLSFCFWTSCYCVNCKSDGNPNVVCQGSAIRTIEQDYLTFIEQTKIEYG